MKNLIKKYQREIFATAGAVLILWQLLLPGYVILLDWPAGPLINFQITDVASLMNLPVNFLLHILNFFLPGWLIQKILMFAIFFGGFYLPLKFYPTFRQWLQSTRKGGKAVSKENIFPGGYFMSLLNVFNPFVYERFLAGQWRVVVGYLSVLPLLITLLNFRQKSTWRNAGKIFLILFITSLFSIHFLAIDGLIILAHIFFWLLISGYHWLVAQIVVERKVNRRNNFRWLGKIMGAGLIFLIVSSYWVLPYALKNEKVIDNFDAKHQRAFATAQNENWSVAKNVVWMHGFWGEDHYWAKKFILPKDTKLFSVIFPLLIVLVIIGWLYLLTLKKTRGEGAFPGVLLLMAIIFSAGVRNNPGAGINQWLFENISFWKGFRDSQKWSGVMVAIYILLATTGVFRLRIIFQRFIQSSLLKTIGVVGILLLPILLTPQMLFGFQKQIQTAWYPTEWQTVADFLKEEEGRRKGKEKQTKPTPSSPKVLFLPWHQYYPVKFNPNGLSYNLASNYFPAEIIAGKNTELWGIKPIVDNREEYVRLEQVLTSNNPSPNKVEETIDILKSQGIEYIIWTNDFVQKDLYQYPFLQSKRLKKNIQTEKITLYQIL